MKKAIIVFVKNPILGHAKTRLAKTLGEEHALRIYKALIQHTAKTISQSEVDLFVYYSQFIEKEDAFTKVKERRIQEGADLGRRMYHAFQALFQEGYQGIIIIGTDCATLNNKHVENAFEALEAVPVVIGPAEDGGYYLLGMNGDHSYVFENIAWSSSSVLNETIAHLQNQGSQFKQLETLSDIDYAEDWERHGWPL